MLTSQKFKVSLIGTHDLVIPEVISRPFVDEGHSRVTIKVFLDGNEISFHRKLHKYLGRFSISFGKNIKKK